jgi:hypothetical protein
MKFKVALVLLVFSVGCSRSPSPEELAAARSRTLVLAVLNVKSSFKKKLEKPADRLHDTLQWWIAPDRAWKIRTFSLDHDMHIEASKRGRDDVQAAVDHIQRQYGDKVFAVHVLTFPEAPDEEQVQQILAKAGLKANLHIDTSGYAYWTPDNAKYRQQTQTR